MSARVRPILDGDAAITLFTGNYGSGKTEVSVNVATALARAGISPITIADLDLVNPYFRCREAREPMEQLGIRVLAPSGDFHNADLPILMPEVRGAIEHSEGPTILDVGGDNVGSTVLAGLAAVLKARPHRMAFVLNRSRPFTETVEGAMRIMDEIETASRMKITHIAGNTHMMEETDRGIIVRGADFCNKIARKRGIKVLFVTMAESLLDTVPEPGTLVRLKGIPAPVLPLKRIMLPVWLGGPAPGSMATHSRDGFARITES